MITFLDEQWIELDYLTLYAEEQLERRISHFFDLLLIHDTRGYEKAWRHEMQMANSARR
jgi:hypothetical protein